MLSEDSVGREIFERLQEEDERVSQLVAVEGCACGGQLNVGKYARKPRFGAMQEPQREWFRFSLCCGRCRRRTLPPSVLFLGRKVYVEVAVVFASVRAQREGLEAAAEKSGVPELTIGRWLEFWREAVPQAAWWREARARFSRPPEDAALPATLVEELAQTGETLVRAVARVLAPATTSMVAVARFSRRMFQREKHSDTCAEVVGSA